MKFVDRERETERLQRALSSPASKLIVIYGRRRMGKSTLIRNVLRPKDVYFEAEINDAEVQRTLLVLAISTIYPGFGGRYDSWESLFAAYNLICAEGSTLVLDEFPYLVKEEKGLPSLLQRLIDSGNLRFHLVICGSSQRMMQKMILGPAEPLFGRAIERLNLGPIMPWHWQQALHLSARLTVEEYAVWGGVPRYWVLREQFHSLTEAVEELILDRHGVLGDEPKWLFFDDATDLASLSSIMTALGQGHHRYARLADALGRKMPELSAPLKALAEMHYVEREVPFGEDPEKCKKTIYQIADPFMGFYYRFVAPNKSYLALGRTQRVKEIIKIHFAEHVSRVWEQLCRRAVSGNVMGDTVWTLASRWWGKVPILEGSKKTPVGEEELEFDVVAESFDGKELLVGECKWAAADYAGRLLSQLRAKTAKAPFAKEYREIKYALFLREAPLDEVPEDAIVMLPEEIIKLL